VSNVGQWLAQLGLEKYAGAFGDAEVDLQALPHLTDADLKELGLPLGPRRKVLAAIEAMAATRGEAAMQALDTGLARPSTADVDARSPPARADAERRQLTVMFVDLVDSTALSTRLDPEEMGDLLRQYQNAVTGEVSRLGGHVAKLMGDGVLAYFGWPVAHEDAAERAVRAGLALCAAVARLTAPGGLALAARAGIATGLVVVGELVGKEEAQERAVVGETPNLAARLQAAAPPGAVIIAQGTQRLLGRLFDLGELPPLALKGIASQQRAWRVLGEGSVEGRFEALHAESVGALVGRDQELGLLLDRWRLAKSGEGQVAVLSGEPGIGKSRIVRALGDSLRSEEPTTLRYFCSPQHTGTPFWPIISQLERAAGFTVEDTPGRRLEKLEALLLPTESGDGVRLLGDLLSTAVDGRGPLPELTPEEKKARTMRALADQLAALSRVKPVLVVLEDAHWLDPTTREVFDLFIERIEGLPVLCVVTCRPEFQSPWTGRPYVTTLTLNRLGRAQAERIVSTVTQGRRLPAPLLEAILSKTEGIPLFVEELTKMILESGMVRQSGEGFEPSGPIAPLAVPDTLRDSLMARLDRFATAREMAQIGAVLGREFDLDMLAAVAGADETAVSAALDQLVAAELVFRRGTPPRLSYTFKHALVQDTAYQSLLRSRRQQLHARTAELLRTRFNDRVAAAPELLAHHLTESGLADAAIEAWLDAGRHGLKRSAFAEVISHLRRGLAIAESSPPSPQRDRAQMRLFNALGQALQSSQGPVAEVESSYRRARSLSDAAGDEREWIRASYGLWFCRNWRMEHLVARQDAQEMLDRVGSSGDTALVLQAHHAAWTSAWQLGAPLDAVAHAEIGRAIYNPEHHHVFTAIDSSHDAGVCCRNTLGIARTLMGELDRGAEAGAEGEALARRVGHPFSRALSLFFRTKVHMLRGEIDVTAGIAREMSALCAQLGVGVYGLVGQVVGGWCQAASGADAHGGIRLIRTALEELRRLGARARRTEYLAMLADRALAIGDLAMARAAVQEAHRLAEETGERFYLAELHRLDAAMCLAADAGAHQKAERHLRRAIDVARHQSARLLELRAAADLARLWAGRGDRRRAHDLLAPIYDWFSEGFDTPQLTDARRLRDALA
jgi:class 3 adenylate cyclase/predicted ATPase